MIEAANVESTAEGDWLNIETDDGGLFAFELSEDGAVEIVHALSDWLRERADSE